MDTHTTIIDGIGKPFYRGGVPRFFDGGLDRFALVPRLAGVTRPRQR